MDEWIVCKGFALILYCKQLIRTRLVLLRSVFGTPGTRWNPDCYDRDKKGDHVQEALVAQDKVSAWQNDFGSGTSQAYHAL